MGVYSWVQTEYPLSKGQGRYKTTIGFLDVVFPWGMVASPALMRKTIAGQSCGLIVVEVKTTKPLVMGDTIRQLRLYQEYWVPEDLVRKFWEETRQWDVGARRLCEATYWVLATTFPISNAERDFLSKEGFHHVFLGDGFQHWIEAREDKACAEEKENSCVSI
jgi:hypothetical protein